MHNTHALVSAMLLNFLAQKPEVKASEVDSRDFDRVVAGRAVIAIELFKEVELGARRRLD